MTGSYIPTLIPYQIYAMHTNLVLSFGYFLIKEFDRMLLASDLFKIWARASRMELLFEKIGLNE